MTSKNAYCDAALNLVRLQALMKDQGLTNESLARLLDRSPTFTRSLLKGYLPSRNRAGFLEKLARILKTTVADLLSKPIGKRSH